MKYYPLLLDLKEKRCIVVGGGRVAQRKVNSLLKAGALVRIISPNLTQNLKKLAGKNKIYWITSHYRKRHIQNSFLVIAAVSDKKINSKISHDAQKAGILVNVVDSPEESNFIVPAHISRGDLIISISTSGKAPALSKRIRKDLTKLLVPRYSKFLKTLESIRKDLKIRCSEPRLRKKILNILVDGSTGSPS
ncbi:MAG: bifunctional precorrin-2 dehydrogenase/sirohydrochlorin ferrochelatase [Candidatus Omnitrophota bacterium]